MNICEEKYQQFLDMNKRKSKCFQREDCISHSYILHRCTLYIYCMLVREIWKFIHPRVSHSLRATPEGIWYSWVN